MPHPIPYEIVIRGRASARLLQPLLDDFTIDNAGHDVTRLVGEVVDASHLHGVLAHLTSVNVDIISVTALQQHTSPPPAVPRSPTRPTDRQNTMNDSGRLRLD